MALQFNLAADNQENRLGIEFPEAYAVLANYSGDKLFVTFMLAICMNAAARAEARQPVTALNLRVERELIDAQEGDSQMAKIYNYVKTLPTFEGAIDV